MHANPTTSLSRSEAPVRTSNRLTCSGFCGITSIWTNMAADSRVDGLIWWAPTPIVDEDSLFNQLWPLHLSAGKNRWFVGLVYPAVYDRENRKRKREIGSDASCVTVGIWLRSLEIVQAITPWDLLSTKSFPWFPGLNVFCLNQGAQVGRTTSRVSICYTPDGCPENSRRTSYRNMVKAQYTDLYSKDTLDLDKFLKFIYSPPPPKKTLPIVTNQMFNCIVIKFTCF